jgi:Spy/CpxP family protein refolding chaperone
MSIMRRDFILASTAVFAAVLAVPAARAQGAGGGPPGGRDPKAMAERQLSELKTRLKLTAEQEPKVKAILEQAATRMRALREKHGVGRGQPPSDAARADLDAARKETKDALAKVLTPEQVTEYEKWQAERRGRSRGPGAG